MRISRKGNVLALRLQEREYHWFKIDRHVQLGSVLLDPRWLEADLQVPTRKGRPLVDRPFLKEQQVTQALEPDQLMQLNVSSWR